MSTHRRAERTSLALHVAVAERLRVEPRLIERARARVKQWSVSGALHPAYVAQWEAIFARSVEDVCAAIVSESEEAIALRQTTPFAGVLDSATRWRIWREAQADGLRA